MAKARQNLKKRAEWFTTLAVEEQDPSKAADFTLVASRLDKRRRPARRGKKR